MTRLVLVLFTLSGMCALIYQILWTRWLGLIVGNFASATATVVAAYMGGLALGNWLIGRLAGRASPRQALRAYAALEAGLAALAAVSPLLLSSGSPLYPALASASNNPFVRALICFVFILPPTILMGGTLPMLVAALSAASPRSLGPLYALNTLGGACGPLLAAFALIPTVGLKASLWMTCVLNAAVALAAFWAAGRFRLLDGDAVEVPTAPAPATDAEATPMLPLATPGASGAGAARQTSALLAPGFPLWMPFLLAGFSGMLSLGFEISLTRAFVLTITGGSVYGFSLILTAYLVGLAGGAWLVKRRPPAGPRAALVAFAVAQSVAWAYSLLTPFWDAIPPVLVRFWWASLPFAAVSAIDFTAILALTLILTTAFGYTLPALAAALPRASAPSIGRLFAANTVGAVIGAPLTGFILLPNFGLDFTLLLLGALALVAAAAAAATALPRLRLPLLVPAPFLLALPFVIPRPDMTVMNAGMYNRPLGFKPGENGNANPLEAAHKLGKIIYQKDSLTARISVRALSPMEMSFVVNGKPDGSTSLVDMYTQIFMAHLPALTHPHPRRVLVIGMGTGTTTGCMTLHPEIEEIHVAEIEPAQIDVARLFYRHNYGAVDQPKVHIHLDDARHYLLTDDSKYDIIVSEPSNLWVSGMVNLFTAEFYENVRRRLNPGGVFFQWIHYYRVGPDDVKGMVATFRSVFPECTFWIHQYGDAFLLAKTDGMSFDLAEWRRRLAEPALIQDFKRLAISPPLEVMGFFLWGPADVERYVRGTPLCTDDFPYLEFTTPRVRYSPAVVQEMRMHMQMYGPLEPVPLVKEKAYDRVMLGDMFYGKASLARARAEYSRALVLSPGNSAAREKLKTLDRIENEYLSAMGSATTLMESFTH